MKKLKTVKPVSAAAALKAERARDMAEAMRDYKDEERARLINMQLLRALRLEKERAESEAAAEALLAKKKKTTIPTGSTGT